MVFIVRQKVIILQFDVVKGSISWMTAEPYQFTSSSRHEASKIFKIFENINELNKQNESYVQC